MTVHSSPRADTSNDGDFMPARAVERHDTDDVVRLSPDEDQVEFGAAVRKFLAQYCAESDVRRLMIDELGHDPKVWKQASEQLGLAGLDSPEQYGGSGATFRELAVVMEALGDSLGCLPFYSTAILAVGALLAAGDPDAHRAYLPGIVAGDTIGTLAMSGTAGVVPAEWPTRAEPAGEDFVLTGRQSFVVDGCAAHLVLVAAQSTHGPSLFAVSGDARGLTRTPMDTLDLTRKLARLELDQVPARLVGAAGSAPAVLDRVRDRAALALACEQLGVASHALATAVDYARTRVQFGRPIGSFQAVKHRCVDMLQRIEAGRSATEWGTATASVGSPSSPVAVAMATVCATEAALFATAESIQVHGGIGFTWEHPAHLYFRRAQSTALLNGSAVDARELLLRRLGV